ncbi:DUF692 domain-containing protein [Vulgatibacter incomptus]|uniref:UPF0276 protein AKJ08_1213 n=1 Tax=Vulgatibacter incomptus TaxID=1391653 RepID=A0A0K1PBP6_9BACT|nr:DUF692 domain-containing protein [Vulgatibacter incomptus]AKU90826.1 hypothetical protein AKJ08_1213 [Vulgatibacter incomptus]
MSITRQELGHGVGLRPKHFGQFFEGRPRLDWIEAVSENFMIRGGRPLAVLEKVRRDMPVSLHGVSLSIGAAEGLDVRYLAELKDLIRRIEPALVSDHLCWGRHGGRYAHDLWPLPYTNEALEHVVSRVSMVQEILGRQILLENVSSYVAYRASTMPEQVFLTQIAERADCGILLDVNNVYVSSRNHGFDPAEYIAALPASRVLQIHLAGHTDKGTYVLDSHDGHVAPEVWELYAFAVQRIGKVPTLIEWDDRIPDLDVLLAESQKAAAVEASVLGRKEDEARRAPGAVLGQRHAAGET